MPPHFKKNLPYYSRLSFLYCRLWDIANCELSYNFTTSRFAAYTSFADSNNDGVINAIDRATVRNSSGELGYLASDISMDGIVNAVDRVLVRNNTFRVSQVP